MSTTEYLDKLTIDQLRFARDEADKRIKAAESKPKKIVWTIGDKWMNIAWYREEEYEQAYDRWVKEIQKAGPKYLGRMVDERHNTSNLNLVQLAPIYENEVEYEEWFK